MRERIRIFVDFWNLQLQWNDTTGKAPLDWPKLPTVLIKEAMAVTGIIDCQYDGTNVYASVDMTAPDGSRLKNWLQSFLDRQAGFNISIRERRPRPAKMHCRSCNREIVTCPFGMQPLRKSGEKGVDAAIVTDMISLAWAGAFNVAILVSSDGDYVPAVQNLQDKGFKIINAAWRNIGHNLARKCWASIEMDKMIPALIRV